MTPVHFSALGHHVSLGKAEPRLDSRTLKLASYIQDTLPAPPTSRAWGAVVPSYPMYANDTLGDCTCAAVGHMEQVWTANEGAIWTPTVDEVTGLYWATGSGDTGRVEIDVLNYWKNKGFGNSPRKIAGYMSVNPLNRNEVKQAVNLFGGVYIGLALPLSAQNQTKWSVVTGPDSQPGSWGGHAVNIVAYSSTGLTCITWGMKMAMTWGFWNAYCDEAYAVLSPDWTSKGTSPNGFNAAQLQTDLAQL